MCYCGTVKKDGFYQCCQDQITMNQESRFNSGQMDKMEMMEFLKAKEQTPGEKAEFKKEWERQVEKDHFQKDCLQETTIDGYTQKIEVAAAYRPKKEVPANETTREELLQRDVGILFEENRRLREENERVMAVNRAMIEQNIKLFKANKRLFYYNQKLNGKVKPNADM